MDYYFVFAAEFFLVDYLALVVVFVDEFAFEGVLVD